MNKLLILFLFLVFSQSSQAASLISVSNNMLTTTNSQSGVMDLGVFDPFNPGANCSTYTAPNSCVANGRNPVKVTLVFNYSVSLDNLDGTSVDLNFTVNNGEGGASAEYSNVIPPASIYSLHHGSLGTFDLTFDVPLFGPASNYKYGLDLTVDVTINP